MVQNTCVIYELLMIIHDMHYVHTRTHHYVHYLLLTVNMHVNKIKTKR